MAHDDDRRVQADDELLEQVQALDVEVVGGLVEQVHVIARQQQGREADASGLATRQGRHRQVEGHVETDVVDHLLDALVEIGAAERQPRLERRGVGIVGARQRIGKRVCRAIELRLRGLHAGASRQVRPHRLAGEALVLLLQVPDVRGGG